MLTYAHRPAVEHFHPRHSIVVRGYVQWPARQWSGLIFETRSRELEVSAVSRITFTDRAETIHCMVSND